MEINVKFFIVSCETNCEKQHVIMVNFFLNETKIFRGTKFTLIYSLTKK